jgi:CRP/FNR family cyclic AMP-dependent transcriptional regulator
MTTLEELRRIPLFAALDDRTLTDTARYMQARTYRPGEYITYEGERAAGVYFVQRGRVRLSRTAPDGREQVLAMVGAGENFNAVAIFDNHGNLTTARAMSAVHCLLLPGDALITLIRRHPDLALGDVA